MTPYLTARGTWEVRIGSVPVRLELVTVPVECEDGRNRDVLWGVCVDGQQILRFVLSWDPEMTPQQVRGSWDAAAEFEARILVGAPELPDSGEVGVDEMWDADKEARIHSPL